MASCDMSFSDVTHDAFLGGLVALAQPAKGYRAGNDAVLCAAACPAKPGEAVMDLGAGVGAIGLCVAARVQDLSLTFIEHNHDIAKICEENCQTNAANGFVCQLDIAAKGEIREAKGLKPAQQHHIVMNPPYFAPTPHKASNKYRTQARQMAQDGPLLEDWIRFACWALKAKGSLTVIYPASGLVDLLNAFGGRFGALSILPISAREGDEANRVIVQGWRDRATPPKLLPPLVLHADQQSYSPQIEQIFRYGAALQGLTP